MVDRELRRLMARARIATTVLALLVASSAGAAHISLDPARRPRIVNGLDTHGYPTVGALLHGSGTLESFVHLLAKGRRSLDTLLNISMELGSTEAVKAALRGGFGISILSRISIQHELAVGSLVEVRVRGLTMERDFYEVSHRRRPLHPIAQAFREFLKQP